MGKEPEKACTDCEGAMQKIRVVYTNIGGHNELQYAVPEAKRGFWSSSYPVEGSIEAFMCQGCGLVKMFGVPSE